jgi:arylsulfatase A-like enzyme
VSRKLGRREFLAASAGAAALAAPRGAFAARRQPARPNVVFILADDLGWGDLSCYGRPDYRTPNLDRLAAEGTRFTQAYAASPVCTPTRCAFMTGQHPARHAVGIEEPLHERSVVGTRVGLEPSVPTVASLLRAAGYETALVGKWHLGYLPKYGPTKSGFDEFYGHLSGAVDFFTHDDMTGERDFFQNEEPVPPTRVGYMTDLLTERAVEYVRRRRARPFYLSLHYNAPHWPWEGPGDAEAAKKEKRGYDAFRGGGSLKVYAEMMRSMDEGIGRVLRALAGAGLQRSTLVVFTSDNGGEHFSYNWPFTGAKGSLREGGIRVPAIIRWPGVVAANRTTEQVAVTMDWTATLLAAAGARPGPQHPPDGIDLLPFVRARAPRAATPRTLFWRFGAQSAVRRGDLKYLHDGAGERLFDLSADVRENGDLKRDRPREFEELKAEFAAWDKQVLPRPPARRPLLD